MGGLNDIEVIETLDAYGFTIRANTPWRAGDPDEWESYPLEIGELPDFSRNRIDAAYTRRLSGQRFKHTLHT
jgi:hypothetical protein